MLRPGADLPDVVRPAGPHPDLARDALTADAEAQPTAAVRPDESAPVPLPVAFLAAHRAGVAVAGRVAKAPSDRSAEGRLVVEERQAVSAGPVWGHRGALLPLAAAASARSGAWPGAWSDGSDVPQRAQRVSLPEVREWVLRREAAPLVLARADEEMGVSSRRARRWPGAALQPRGAPAPTGRWAQESRQSSARGTEQAGHWGAPAPQEAQERPRPDARASWPAPIWLLPQQPLAPRVGENASAPGWHVRDRANWSVSFYRSRRSVADTRSALWP